MKTLCSFIGCLGIFVGPLLAQQHGSTSMTTDPAALTKNFMSWWSYYNSHTRLSADFISLGTNRTPINKEPFFDSLVTGSYIPVKLPGVEISYYLFPLGELSTTDARSISSTISNVAFYSYAHYRMLGKELPAYQFTDLKGNSYTSENTRGKLLVIKCWFINCAPCIAEMPVLNTLVKTYRKQQDILFVSIAFDQSDKLREFLAKKDFAYAVVPDKQSWLMDKAGITNYPTHIIVNKEGIIIKVIETAEELGEALQKITKGTN